MQQRLDQRDGGTPPQPNPWRRKRTGMLAGLVIVAITLALALPIPAPLIQVPSIAGHADDPNQAEAVAASPVTVSPLRTSIAPPAGDAVTAADRSADPAPAAGSFADYVDRLVAIGLETTRLATMGDRGGARANDEQAKTLFGELMTNVRDADAEALAALGTNPSVAANATVAEHLRQRILDLVLDHGLRRRFASIPASADGTTDADRDPDDAGAAARWAEEREQLDHLVTAVLTALPANVEFAHRIGLGLLADAPYLGLAHEPIVLDLVALSGDGKFPADVATALLATLWRNLQQAGQRTSDQLAGLCLLLLDRGNVSERLAAGQRLLADERFRLVVLEHLRRTKDQDLARALAMTAAQELPPATAFAFVAAVAPLAGNGSGPLLLLGHRDPALLQAEYEHRLADDVEPRLRELLVAGIGFTGGEHGIEVARIAFASDPDPEVRLRALLVLTAQAGDTLGEQAVTAALDDPRIRTEPFRLSTVVMALGNLAHAGMPNAIDRLAQRLLACPALNEASRVSLQQILAESLPGGSRR